MGVVPLILAFVGLVAAPRERTWAAWRLVAPLTLVMATMPGWWPDGFYILLHLPGVGWFRAPARYTLLTSLGLVLFAGRGLDLGRSVSPRRFWGGLALAVAFGGRGLGLVDPAGAGGGVPGGHGGRHDRRAVRRRRASPGCWAWRRSSPGGWARRGVGAGVRWRCWSWACSSLSGRPGGAGESGCPNPARSCGGWPKRARRGLVAGRLLNVPVDAGLTTAFPYLGIMPPPPNYLLETTMRPPGDLNATQRRWLRPVRRHARRSGAPTTTSGD